MFQWLIIAMSVHQCLAWHKTYDNIEDFEDWPRSVGLPGTAAPPFNSNSCKKDILFLLDASNSIGPGNFKTVTQFMKNFIESPKLNVAPDGSHIALITFSDKDHTGIKFNFGKYTKTKQLKDYINKNLIWGQVNGPETRTGKAAEIADTQIFDKDSPLNGGTGRDKIADVVILLTDGEPRGGKKYEQLNLANKHMTLLKKKKVLVVGVAIGTKVQRAKFSHTILNMATSNKTMFDVEFDGLDKILNSVVDASCTPFNPGDCSCPNIHSQDLYIKAPATTKNVMWTPPALQCKDDKTPPLTATSVNPDYQSPHDFPVGNHSIEYKYTFKGGSELKCYVHIVVKSCTCPAAQNVVGYVSDNPGTTSVTWKEPAPNCQSTLKQLQPNKPSRSTFGAGLHTVNYVYDTSAGELTCSVNIDIKNCVCQSSQKEVYMKPDSPNGKVSVNWVEPTPVCQGQSVLNTIRNPNVKPGDSFAPGNYYVDYTYKMTSNIYVQCRITIVVKVVPCMDVNYDPSTHMCCCGKVQIIKPGHKCCGRKTYDTATQRCCPMGYNVRLSSEPCPEDNITI